MAECSEGLEISPRPAAEIQDRKRGLDFDMVQQRRDVLRDVVVVRAVAEIFRVRVVVLQRDGTDFIEVAGVEFHAGSISRGISRTTTSYLRCHRSWSVARRTG